MQDREGSMCNTWKVEMLGPSGSPELFVHYCYHLGDEVRNGERWVEK